MQRRIIFRWTSTAALASILILVASTVLIEFYYLEYLASTGLEYLSYQVDSLPAIPYTYIPIIGFIAVMLSSWAYLTEARSFVRARPGISPPNAIMPARMFESSFALLTILVAVLYLPYVFGSNWMINILFSLKTSFPALASPVSWFYSGIFLAAMGLSPIWKYILSNLVTYTVIVAAVLILGRGSRRGVRTR